MSNDFKKFSERNNTFNNKRFKETERFEEKQKDVERFEEKQKDVERFEEKQKDVERFEEKPKDVERLEEPHNLDDNEKFYGYNYGYVRNCGKLRVRKSPSESSEILQEISSGDLVRYNPKLINSIWNEVITSKGIKGYCMSSYIKED